MWPDLVTNFKVFSKVLKIQDVEWSPMWHRWSVIYSEVILGTNEMIRKVQIDGMTNGVYITCSQVASNLWQP